MSRKLWDNFHANLLWGLDLSQSLQGAGGIGGLLCSVDGGKTRYFLYDANGNVGQVVDAADGSVSASYRYDAFGNSLEAEGAYAGENAFRFSTKYLDAETGLYYYGFRHYSAGLGRWVSRDPINEKDIANLYNFVLNNPADGYDFLGQYTLTDAKQALNEKLCSSMTGFRHGICMKNSSNKRWSDKDIFNSWWELELEDMRWTYDLPTPPPCLEKKDGKYVLPFGFPEWKQPQKVKFKKYHPKGEWEVRTVSANSYGAGNQGIYDDNGILLTGGYSAGSADRRQADSAFVTVLKLGQGGHIMEDVEPFDLAMEIDNGYGISIQKYIEVRPTIVPLGAKKHVLDPF